MIVAPSWFFGYDIVLELLFAIITLVVALLGYKVYKATSQKQSLYLAGAFFLISISYILQSILNFLILTKLNENICVFAQIQSVNTFNIFGIYIHMLFMLLGLSLLTYMTLRTSEIRGLYLISAVSLAAVFLSRNPIYIFYVISSLLLINIAWFFIVNYLKNKKTKTLLIAIAFLFLLFGSVHFLFAVNHQVFYVIGHFLALIAFILVFLNFLVLKR